MNVVQIKKKGGGKLIKVMGRVWMWQVSTFFIGCIDERQSISAPGRLPRQCAAHRMHVTSGHQSGLEFGVIITMVESGHVSSKDTGWVNRSRPFFFPFFKACVHSILNLQS